MLKKGDNPYVPRPVLTRAGSAPLDHHLCCIQHSLTCHPGVIAGVQCRYWTTGPLKQALASKPAIVVLMLGTNDAKFHNWGPLHDEFPVVGTAFLVIVARARALSLSLSHTHTIRAAVC